MLCLSSIEPMSLQAVISVLTIYRKNRKIEEANESLAKSVMLRQFACSVCLKLFDSGAQQRMHERTEHGENREEYHEIS